MRRDVDVVNTVDGTHAGANLAAGGATSLDDDHTINLVLRAVSLLFLSGEVVRRKGFTTICFASSVVNINHAFKLVLFAESTFPVFSVVI